MSASPSGSPSVLVLDDHADTREMLCLVFKEAGFRVCEAGSVDEAIQCLRDDPPALILSDIAMPGATGVHFIEYLRQDAAHRSIPVIVVTGRNPAEIRIEAHAIVQKPIDPDSLLETAKRVLTHAN